MKHRLCVLAALSFCAWSPTHAAPDISPPPSVSHKSLIILDPLPKSALAQHFNAASEQQATVIGVGREVVTLNSPDRTKSHLRWRMPLSGRNTAVITVRSPGAVAIRLGMQITALADETELRFLDQHNALITQFNGRQVNHLLSLNRHASENEDLEDLLWSPIIPGDTASLEIVLPSGSPEPQLAIPRLSHLFSDLSHPQARALGDAGNCNLDATCYPDWSAPARATAKMRFTASNGTSSTCTGTLLASNPAGSGTPYFITARHCISEQNEASSLQTSWFYQSDSCGSSRTDPRRIDFFDGAELLALSSTHDQSLLRLNHNAPAGAVFAGWRPYRPAAGSQLTGVHHPMGDLKKISFGRLDSYVYCSDDKNFTCDPSAVSAASDLNVTFEQGITESGSSGSGIFDQSGLLLGTLRGGGSSCFNPSGSDSYGLLAGSYNNGFANWLDPVANPAASLSNGEQLSALGAEKDSLNWYTLDVPAGSRNLEINLAGGIGDADLYVRLGEPPSFGSYDCRSYEQGNNERCWWSQPQAGRYYISLHGYEAYSGARLSVSYSGGELTPPATGPVDLVGRISMSDGSPLCAMVLANGQYTFSCDGNGNYSLGAVPLDAAGQITQFVFVDGFAPLRQTFIPGSNSVSRNLTASLSNSAAQVAVNMSAKITSLATQTMRLAGNITTAAGVPLCGMVLANGLYQFSCGGNGGFDLTVPLDNQQSVTLFVFVDGFAPFRWTYY